MYSLEGFKYIKLRIDNVGDEVFNSRIILNITKYDILNNMIIAKIYKENTLTEEEKYNLYQLTLYKEILERNYTLAEIQDFIEDETIKRDNIYYNNTVKLSFVKSLNSSFLQLKQDLNMQFKEFVENKINTNQIKGNKTANVAFEIYDKTIIRYVMPLNEFLEIISTVATAEINKEADIKVLEKCLENEYKVNFLRYRVTQIVKIINTNNVEIEEFKKYKITIKKYDMKNKMFILDI